MPEYELDYGKYFWPWWVRRPLVVLFRLEGDDGQTRWERKRLAKRYRENCRPPSKEARDAFIRLLEGKEETPSGKGEG